MAYTRQCLLALRWFAEREPVGWFDRSAPNHSMRAALERRSLIRRLPKQHTIELTRFELTGKGRETMREATR